MDASDGSSAGARLRPSPGPSPSSRRDAAEEFVPPPNIQLSATVGDEDDNDTLKTVRLLRTTSQAYLSLSYLAGACLSEAYKATRLDCDDELTRINCIREKGYMYADDAPPFPLKTSAGKEKKLVTTKELRGWPLRGSEGDAARLDDLQKRRDQGLLFPFGGTFEFRDHLFTAHAEAFSAELPWDCHSTEGLHWAPSPFVWNGTAHRDGRRCPVEVNPDPKTQREIKCINGTIIESKLWFPANSSNHGTSDDTAPHWVPRANCAKVVVPRQCCMPSKVCSAIDGDYCLAITPITVVPRNSELRYDYGPQADHEYFDKVPGQPWADVAPWEGLQDTAGLHDDAAAPLQSVVTRTMLSREGVGMGIGIAMGGENNNNGGRGKKKVESRRLQLAIDRTSPENLRRRRENARQDALLGEDENTPLHQLYKFKKRRGPGALAIDRVRRSSGGLSMPLPSAAGVRWEGMKVTMEEDADTPSQPVDAAAYGSVWNALHQLHLQTNSNSNHAGVAAGDVSEPAVLVEEEQPDDSIALPNAAEGDAPQLASGDQASAAAGDKQPAIQIKKESGTTAYLPSPSPSDSAAEPPPAHVAEADTERHVSSAPVEPSRGGVDPSNLLLAADPPADQEMSDAHDGGTESTDLLQSGPRDDAEVGEKRKRCDEGMEEGCDLPPAKRTADESSSSAAGAVDEGGGEVADEGADG
ncbi:unnamed protein product [Vitrella brassicaformis CCMP3155]|uniref:SET domain-containing protein n=2 Tax=Vitrella brassicaformis TaxID=1169539 RepID=A0A0G4F3P4_VITBC|nr:unnamed protein product [Vitrella brassicaformis CCMP3155]|eukprot:CEM06257.1 unnamed protein product [Vitrella brassicaformis CCMP3155]